MGLSFLVPGLPQLLLGRTVRGIAAFVSTVGLFVVGYAIVGERLWAFELFKPFTILKPVLGFLPLNLLPDVGNAGCSIVAAMLRPPETDEMERLMRLPRAFEHLGLTLTGISGMLGFLWASDAFACAKPKLARPTLAGTAAIASWILPGSGHFLVGQKDKGLLMGGAVLAMWALGLAFGLGHSVDRPLLSAWWIGQAGFGGGVLAASFTTAPLVMDTLPSHYDLGFHLCTIAGLMNLVVIVDAYTRGEAAQAAPAEVPA